MQVAAFRILPALVLIAFLHLLPSFAAAQQNAGDEMTQVPDVAVLIKAEADLQVLNSGQFVRDQQNLPYRIERRLNEILERDPGSPLRFQIEQDLTAVGEILGAKHLAIATLYLNRYRERGTGLKGAQGRLLIILQKYPHFSRMDEVLLMMAEVSMREELPDDASAYLRRLISDYPSSSRVAVAIEQLIEIPPTASERRDKPEPQ
jgi:outer membrane protein assembly factor BamD (BamD/ComL family)